MKLPHTSSVNAESIQTLSRPEGASTPQPRAEQNASPFQGKGGLDAIIESWPLSVPIRAGWSFSIRSTRQRSWENATEP